MFDFKGTIAGLQLSSMIVFSLVSASGCREIDPGFNATLGKHFLGVVNQSVI